jgi:hypothetical protein
MASVFDATSGIASVTSIFSNSSRILSDPSTSITTSIAGVTAQFASSNSVARKLLTNISGIKELNTKFNGILDTIGLDGKPAFTDVWNGGNPPSIGSRTNDAVRTSPPKPTSVWDADPKSHLLGVQSRDDPQQGFNWTAYILEGEGIKPWYIDEITTPQITFESSNIYRAGKNHTFAGMLSIESIDITFYCDSKGMTQRFASSWLNAVFDYATNSYNLPSQYKKTIVIQLIAPDGSIWTEFKLLGCFPTSQAGLNLGYNSEALAVRLTVNVDNIAIDKPVDPMYTAKFPNTNAPSL